jgi:geranylgeranyl diphosphate synthase type II
MPSCAGQNMLYKLVRAQSSRFIPEKLGQVAA